MKLIWVYLGSRDCSIFLSSEISRVFLIEVLAGEFSRKRVFTTDSP